MDKQRPQVVLDGQELVPAICQDAATGQVLMLAYVNPHSLRRTLKEGEMVFYSRSRQELWHKGETSGSYLHVESAQVDCDGDTLLFQVHADGPACHTGQTSCFFTPLSQEPDYVRSPSGPAILEELFQVIQERQQERPQGSYTASLFASGTSRIAQKVAEEAAELAIAAASGDKAGIPTEAADLVYHALVLLADAGCTTEDVWRVLRARREG